MGSVDSCTNPLDAVDACCAAANALGHQQLGVKNHSESEV